MARTSPLPRSSQRGAALLLAVVSIAILTALATDLAYETQVRLHTAANARDELRAEALAQSAVNVGRFVLAFQKQIDTVSTAANAAFGGGQAGAATTGTAQTATAQAGATQASAAGVYPRIQIWNLVPISSALTQSLFADGAAGKATKGAKAGEGAAPAVQPTSLADFQGGFQATIEDEGQKINAQLDAQFTSGVLAPEVEALLRLMCDSKWDPLFDRTDADGQRYSRSDVVVHLRDWVNSETTSSALAASFPGGNCSFVVNQNPFEKAFSDKNYAYDRGPDRYKAKNARFDSLEELHLVAGITDPWMAAYGDQLTVYLPREAAMNVNSTDPVAQLHVAEAMADPASLQAKRVDPTFLPAFQKALSSMTMGGLISITPAQFAAALEAQGVKIRPEVVSAQNAHSPFTDRSVVYRISALGVAGDVTHQTDVVVSFDPNLVPIEERPPPGSSSNVPDMGRLIHWRED